MTVRVRIAPSPTGSLHVGNVRSGLFNWLFARHHGGTFILRVDDTDLERSEERYLDEILDGFRWLGLDWDEGVGVGGPHGTYRQSDRFDRYAEVVDGFLASDAAYRCFCTPAELDARRNLAQKEGRPPGYDGRCGVLSAEEGQQRASTGEKYSIRLRMPDHAIVFEDIVRGEMRFAPETQDDFVIVRTSGAPTYHLASSVDDVDYEISHVARGEDLLSSTPKHIAIAWAMGAEPATYAHLPLLFGPDGKKLSKRHGDTSLRAFREQGFLPEAMFNFMCLLGWSPGNDEEVITRDEAVARFDLDAVQKNSAVFDTKKLEWLNGEYIRALDADDFIDRVLPALGDLTEEQEASFRSLAPLVQERTKRLEEAADQVQFLFVADDGFDYDESSWNKQMTKEFSRPSLEGAMAVLDGLGEWTTESIEAG
ncbi:MAG: glutamate--tRNA ligase, partial [Acidimicrobiia bacterium]|nr:glutamate--tRNA ligase [Acidimicrobiia bacterium]